MADSAPRTTVPSTTGPAAHRSRPQQAKLLLAGAAIVLAVLFGVVNLDTVKIHWIVTTTHNALIVVIAVSFVLGGIFGFALSQRRARRG